jgi:hypothetical protein
VNKRLAFVLGCVFAVASKVAHACATCGLNASFSPKMLFISLGFVGLPLGFAAIIGYLLWRDEKRRKQKRLAPKDPS